MFAITAAEALLLVVWTVGVVAAVYGAGSISSRRRQLALLVTALVLPVLGSVIAIAVAGAVVVRGSSGGSGGAAASGSAPMR